MKTSTKILITLFQVITLIETNTFILSNVVIQIFGLTENEYALNIALAPLSTIYLVIIFKLIIVVWRSKKAKLLNKLPGVFSLSQWDHFPQYFLFGVEIEHLNNLIGIQEK